MIPWTLAALASEPDALEISPGAFRIQRFGASIDVSRVALPKTTFTTDTRLRICRVAVSWRGDRWVAERRDGCHPNVVEPVDEAAASWQIDVKTPPGRDRELFEYWYVFPVERGEPVRVMLRQAYEQQVTLTVPEIDLLDWSVSARQFPQYPAEALEMDTEQTVCSVKVDVAPTGTPGDVVVSDCDEVFRAPLEKNLRGWRFGSPELEGVPFWSGVTFGAKFKRPLGPDDPGSVELLVPPDADLGERSRGRTVEAPEEWVPPPNPTWPALFVVDHRSYAQVGIYDVRWPKVEGLTEEATCDILFQVNSVRRVWAWSEDCDDEVRSATESAAASWLLKHGEVDKGEWYARFRGTFVFPADGGHVYLRVPVDDLVTPASALPEHVRTYRVPSLSIAVPPRLPKGFATEVLDEQVVCEYEVLVGPNGKPAELSVVSCPGGLDPFAEDALGRWRWIPAEADGKPIVSRTTVRIRFDLRVADERDG